MCPHCDSPTRETSYGGWCDSCGGVRRAKDNFYVRSVVRVHGPGREKHLDINYDDSFKAYSVVYEKRILVPVRGSQTNEHQYVQKTMVSEGSLMGMLDLAASEVGGRELETLTGATPTETAALTR